MQRFIQDPADARYLALPTTGIQTAQVAAVASLASVTSPNDGAKHLYRVSGSVCIAVLGSGGEIFLQVNYTDSGGTARTCIVPLHSSTGGLNTVSATTADDYKGSMVLLVNPNAAITVQTAGSFAGCTYHAAAAIERLS